MAHAFKNCFVLYFCSVYVVSGWQYFTSIDNLRKRMYGRPEQVFNHSEFIYGDCDNKKINLFTHIHVDQKEVPGKLIMRKWLTIPTLPTCIRLRATPYEEDTYRNTDFQFQVCVGRIAYIYSQQRFLYYYYEWYLPRNMPPSTSWDIYFFGPNDPDWL